MLRPLWGYRPRRTFPALFQSAWQLQQSPSPLKCHFFDVESVCLSSGTNAQVRPVSRCCITKALAAKVYVHDCSLFHLRLSERYLPESRLSLDHIYPNQPPSPKRLHIFKDIATSPQPTRRDVDLPDSLFCWVVLTSSNITAVHDNVLCFCAYSQRLYDNWSSRGRFYKPDRI